MAEFNIFLSYSRQDIHLMRSLRDLFNQYGFTIWTDEGITPGTKDWQISIEEGIQNSDCLVCLFSPDAKYSKWVKAELWRAEKFDIPIFPIIVRGTDLDAIPLGFEHSQFVDLRKCDVGDYHDLLKTLLDTMSKFKNPIDRNELTTRVKLEPKSVSQIAFKDIKDRIQRLESLDNAQFLTPYLTNYIREFIPEPFELVYIPTHKLELSRSVRFANQARTGTKNIQAFYIAKFPVTVGQFVNFLDSEEVSSFYRHRPVKLDATFAGEIFNKKHTHNTHPVTGISWHDAVAFIDWLSTVSGIGISLPNEIQWFASCGNKQLLMADHQVISTNINAIKIQKPDNQKDYVNSILDTHPVTDGFINKIGVTDGIGNAWEWCEDNNPDVYRTFMTNSISRFGGVKIDPFLNNTTERLIALWGGYVLEVDKHNNYPRLLSNRPQKKDQVSTLSSSSFRTTSRIAQRNSTFGFRLCVDMSSIKKIFLT